MASIMRRQNIKVGDAVFVGRFLKARCGIPDAVQKVMEGFGICSQHVPAVCMLPPIKGFFCSLWCAWTMLCSAEVKNSVAFRQLSPEVRVGEILDHEG